MASLARRNLLRDKLRPAAALTGEVFAVVPVTVKHFSRIGVDQTSFILMADGRVSSNESGEASLFPSACGDAAGFRREQSARPTRGAGL